MEFVSEMQGGAALAQAQPWCAAEPDARAVTPGETPGARDGGPRRGERSERRGKETELRYV